ncbi:MAG: sensor histidine kinase [Candidatus Berkiellales bacterium]
MKGLFRFIIQRPYRLPILLAIVGGIAFFGYSARFGFDHLVISCALVGVIALLLIYFILRQSQQTSSEEIHSLDKLTEQKSTLEKQLEEQTRSLTDKNQQLEQAIKSLKDTQQQLISQEKMASIGMLMAGIAHEIKNPLNFINNFSDTTIEMLQELKDEVEKIANLPEETKNTLKEIIEDVSMTCKKINEHGKRAESIIKNMLIQSRSAETEKTPIDINALLEEYLNLAYHGLRAQNNKFNAKIEKHLDPNLGLIPASPQNIGRVFLNIINNGLYAANEKSEREIAKGTKPPFMPVIMISTEQTPKEVIIKIKDNGNGIPDEIKDKIFEPFFTTKPVGQGTGLGLPICYDIIVEEHKGKLEVNSKLGEFSEFIIVLPKESRETQ